MQRQIDLFLKFMATEKESSDNTIAAYRNDLGQFKNFINTQKPKTSKAKNDWSKLTKKDVSAFMTYLVKEKKLAATTTARKLAAVKSIFKHLKQNGLIEEDPSIGIKSPQVTKNPPHSISHKQILKLLEEPANDATPKGLRDKAILEMLYATGMRVTELINLNVSSIDLSKATVLAARDGKRERTITFNAEVTEYLRRYLEKGREVMAIVPGESALFLNHRGRRLTRQGLWLIIKGYVKDVGIEDSVTPHTLRHSFAAHLLNSGAELQELQETLGHASLSTTQVYRQDDNASEIIIDGKAAK